jgi:hypothetical protein
MKGLKLVTLLLLFGYARSSEYVPYDLIVNLGGDCQVEYQMQINNLRNFALPFDYLITPVDSLVKLLVNKFHNFLAKKHLVLVQADTVKYVNDRVYDINLMHDFTFSGNTITNYDAVKTKFARRIKRLFGVIEQSNKVLFIRKTVTKKDAHLISEVLKSLFPTKTFTLLALDSTDEIKEDWDIEGVKNIFLHQPDPYVWTGDDQAWKEIFAQFNFKLKTLN